MKQKFTHKCKLLIFHALSAFFILIGINTQAQQGLIGTGFGTDWSTIISLSPSAGTSFIATLHPSNTGDRYFRTVINSGGNYDQYTITNGTDVSVSVQSEITATAGPTTNGAMYLNVLNTTDFYVFKTAEGGANPTKKLIIFRVQGTPITVSSVARVPVGNVSSGQDVTINATTSASLPAGQSVYLRYTSNNWTSSVCVQMAGSTTAYSATIPAASNTANATLKYYVFTSGENMTIDPAKADWYTINMNNNVGFNYSYTVVDPSLSMHDDGLIYKNAEAGEVITVNLAGAGYGFVSTLTPANWTFANLPLGVTVGTITRESNTQVRLTLSGNATTNYNDDITNFTVTVAKEEIDGYPGSSLVVNTGVVFKAIVQAGSGTVKKVVLQAFWWDYWNNNYPNGWSNYLADLAPRLKALDIDAIWIPPTIKNAGTNSVGYMPFDQYDLGDKFQKGSTKTRFGTKDEFLRMVAIMHANGIEVIQDVVLNHSGDAGSSNGDGGVDPAASSNQYKNFRYSCWETPVPYVATSPFTSGETATDYLARKGRWSKNWQNFHPNPYTNSESGDWAAGYWGPDFSYGYNNLGDGNGWGLSSNATYNPIQASGYNRDQARSWILWLKKQTGVDGFRWDAVKHFPHYIVQDLSWNLKYGAGMPTWAKGNETMFNVGEYVGGKSDLDNYVNTVKGCNSGTDELIGTFDFGLRGAIYGMITGNGGYDLGSIPAQQQERRVTYYSNGSKYVHRTVPFVNNHDTYRPITDASGNITGWNTGSELAAHIDPNDGRMSAAYAIAFAVDGNPQIFFEDLFNLGISKRYSHKPANADSLPVRSDIANIIWCHQNLKFGEGAYKVRWQAQDLLIIERSSKAIIAVNDNWSTWQHATIATDFAAGTILKDYSGANSGTIVVQGDQSVYISAPPCDGSANNGRRGYSIWAPEGLDGYIPPRDVNTNQEWEMSNDLGDCNCNSLTQGGATPDNSTTERLVGKIYVTSGTPATVVLTPKIGSNSLSIRFYDLNGLLLAETSGTGSLTLNYTPATEQWLAIKVGNTASNTTGQGCYVHATYLAPLSLSGISKPAINQASIWTGNQSTDITDCRNWENGVVCQTVWSGAPLYTNVVIPASNDLRPIQVTSTNIMSCKDLEIGTGRSLYGMANSQIHVTGNLTIKSGALLQLASTSNITVDGTIDNQGTITLKSDASGSANLVTKGTVSGSGTVNVERYFTANAYHYISSPLSAVSAYIFNANGTDANFYFYDESKDMSVSHTNGWSLMNSSANMTVGKGYTFFRTSNTTKTFTGGTINTGTITTPITYHALPGKHGWNLIGNPYPCTLDATLFLTDNPTIDITTPIDGVISLWNGNGYATWNPTIGGANLGSEFINNGSLLNHGKIASNQAFFVHITSAIDVSTNATFTDAMKVSGDQHFFKKTETVVQRVKIDIQNPSALHKETLIGFVDGATAGFDRLYDGNILKDYTNLEIYSIVNSDEYAIQGQPYINPNEDREIKLGVDANAAGTFKLSMKTIENLDNSINVYLIDIQTNTITNLRTTSLYSCTLASGSNKTRFKLLLTQKVVTNLTTWNGTSWSNGLPNATKIVFINGNYTIGTNDAGANMEALNLTVDNGAILTINPNQSLTVNGILTINTAQGLVVKSDASGTGSLITKGTVTGNAKIERYLGTRTTGTANWRYLASPVNTQAGSLTSQVFAVPFSGKYAFYWNENEQKYTDIIDNSTVLSENMRGYAVPSASARTLGFIGTPNTGNQTIALTRQNSGAFSGFNLIGNPYPSAINIFDFTSQTGVSNVDASIWYRTEFGAGMNYATYNSLLDMPGTNGGQKFIPAAQAFWVRVSEGQTSGAVKLIDNQRTHQPQPFYKKTAYPMARFEISRESYKDETLMMFIQNAIEGFNNYDSEKMPVGVAEQPEIYSIVGDKKLAINTLPQINETYSYSIGYKTGLAGQLTIRLAEVTEMPQMSILLEDKLLNKTVNLRDASYTFASDATENLTRFALHYKSSATGISKENGSKSIIYAIRRTIIIQSAEDAWAEVYDLTGKLLLRKYVREGTTNDLELSHNNTGIYLVKLTGNKTTKNQKILVNE